MESASVAYDSASIEEWIEHILQIENDNFSLLRKRAIPCRFLRYEDIVRNETVTLEAFSYPLLSRALRDDEFSKGAARPGRMADKWNLDAEERFREERPEFTQGLDLRRLMKR
jgi:hypothetical protein